MQFEQKPKGKRSITGNVVNLSLIRSSGAPDTTSALTSLLERACNGKVVGLVAAWIETDGSHQVSVTGRYQQDPILGIGAVSHALFRMNRRAHGDGT